MSRADANNPHRLRQIHDAASNPRRTGTAPRRQGAGWPVYSGAINAFTKDFAMKRLISSLAALVAVACLVTACGQKGPLYLPDDTKTPEEQAKSQSHKHL
jgi:predicted small lipoprotein YifL